MAHNLGTGKGLTIDGIHKTNGFQPLWVLLVSPIFMFIQTNKHEALRYILIVHWIIYVSTAYLLGLIVRDLFPDQTLKKTTVFYVTMLIYLCMAYALINHFNGLETGLMLLLYSLALRMYQVLEGNRLRDLWGVGIILGCTVLARIDAVFWVIVVSASMFVDSRFRFARRLRRAFTVAATALIVSLPWWLYNIIGFNSLMPSSGQAQQAWGVTRQRVLFAITQIVKMCLPFGQRSLLETIHGLSLSANIRSIILILLLFTLLWKLFHQHCRLLPEDLRRQIYRNLWLSCCLFITMVILILWYICSSFAWYFYGRYFAPLLMLVTIYSGFFIVKLGFLPELNKEIVRILLVIPGAILLGEGGALLLVPSQHPVIFGKYSLLKFCLASGAILIGFGSTMGVLKFIDLLTLQVNQIVTKKRRLAVVLYGLPFALVLCCLFLIGEAWQADTSQYNYIHSAFYSIQLDLVNTYVPEHDYVAARQTGTLGFFRERVINLDGKVNPEALQHKDQLVQYLKSKQIRWLCDWHGQIMMILGETSEQSGWSLVAKSRQSSEESTGFELYYYQGKF